MIYYTQRDGIGSIQHITNKYMHGPTGAESWGEINFVYLVVVAPRSQFLWTFILLFLLRPYVTLRGINYNTQKNHSSLLCVCVFCFRALYYKTLETYKILVLWIISAYNYYALLCWVVNYMKFRLHLFVRLFI